MSTANAIRKLLASGFTVEQALAAAEAFEAEQQPQRTKRQERNARYYMENKEALAAERRLKSSDPSETTESSEQEVQEKEGPHTPKEKLHTPIQKATPSSSPNAPIAASKADPIPPDWRPTERDLEIIETGGLPRRCAEQALPEFRVYWLGRHEENPRDARAKKRSWGRTFQNYCLMNRLRLSRGNPPRGSPGLSFADIAQLDRPQRPVDEPGHNPTDQRPSPRSNSGASGFAGRLPFEAGESGPAEVLDLRARRADAG